MKRKVFILKRILSSVIAMLLSFSLISCGSGEEEESSELHSIAADAGINDSSDLVKKLKYASGIKLSPLKIQGFTIMMNVGWSDIRSSNSDEVPAAVYHAINIYQNAYNKLIMVDMVDNADMTDTLALQIAAGTAPDLILGDIEFFTSSLVNNNIQPLNNYSDHLELENDDIYNKQLMDLFKINGEYMYAIYEDIPNKDYVIYNKTKFEQKNEKTPFEHWKEGNWNWTQFIQTAKTMTDPSKSEYGFAGNGLYPYNGPYPITRVNESGTIDLLIRDSKFFTYASAVFDLYQNYASAEFNFGVSHSESGFLRGNHSMYITTFSNYEKVAAVMEKISENVEIGIAPLPVFDLAGETVTISRADISGYAIPTSAKNASGAAEFIRLEALVKKNILADENIDRFGNAGVYLNSEEKDMILSLKSQPVSIDPVLFINKCSVIIREQINSRIFSGKTSDSAELIYNSAIPALEAEIEKYNKEINNAKISDESSK